MSPYIDAYASHPGYETWIPAEGFIDTAMCFYDNTLRVSYCDYYTTDEQRIRHRADVVVTE